MLSFLAWFRLNGRDEAPASSPCLYFSPPSIPGTIGARTPPVVSVCLLFCLKRPVANGWLRPTRPLASPTQSPSPIPLSIPHHISLLLELFKSIIKLFLDYIHRSGMGNSLGWGGVLDRWLSGRGLWFQRNKGSNGTMVPNCG
jgi:hypothetical protein